MRYDWLQYGPLSAIVKNAAKKHTATVIFSHGLGDSGSGWSFLPSELPSLNDHVKYIFPTAKSQPVSVYVRTLGLFREDSEVL